MNADGAEDTKTNEIEQARNDFRMLYSIHIDDIKYLKARQWSVTYYLLLVYPAIIGFSSVTNLKTNNALLEQKVLVLIAFLIATLGTFYLCDFQRRLSSYRKSIVKISLGYRLSKDFAEFEKDEGIDEPEEYTSFFNGFWTYTLPFILMLWLGVEFVFYYFFGSPLIGMSLAYKIANTLGYGFIILGSVGMIGFAAKFSFS